MPDRRLQKCRDAYRCWNCDGDGRIEDIEGSYNCEVCSGTGVSFDPRPKPTRGRSFPAANWVTRDGIDMLQKNIAVMDHIFGLKARD